MKIIRRRFFVVVDILWPLKICLHDFAQQSLHCSIILQGKEQSLRDFAGQRTKALWFRGAKSALLHNFAGQSLHCYIILRCKDIDFRVKIRQVIRFFLFLKKIFYYVTVISKICITMVTTFKGKNKLQGCNFKDSITLKKMNKNLAYGRH